MDVTNTTNANLILPTGEQINKGETLNVEKFDDKHHVVSAWVKSGALTVEEAKAAEPDADANKGGKTGAKK